MKKIMFILCFVLALCACRSITVKADNEREDEHYIYYETGVYDKDTGDYLLYGVDGYLDDNDNFILGMPNNDVSSDSSDSTLSDEHLKLLESLGALLEYMPTGDEEEINIDDIDIIQDYKDDIPDTSDYIQDIAQNVSSLSDIALLSDYNTYVGAISTTYLEYFRGFLGKLPYNYHYVCYRESQYVYSFVFGKELQYNNHRFTGSNVIRVTWNTYNSGSYAVNTESSFGLNTGSNMVYTDLGVDYPALVAYDGYQLIQIKWLLLIGALTVWMTTLYKGFHRPVDKDRYSAHKNAD